MNNLNTLKIQAKQLVSDLSVIYSDIELAMESGDQRKTGQLIKALEQTEQMIKDNNKAINDLLA